jgi:hypothetical protein
MKVEITFRSGSRVLAEVEDFDVDSEGKFVWTDLPEEEQAGRRVLCDLNPRAVDCVVVIPEED